MKYFVWILAAIVLSGSGANATVIDTLSAFNPNSRYHYYRIHSVSAQAARFQPVAGGKLIRASVLLGGATADGTARLRVFGNEIGAAVPFMEQDLVAPITLKKTQKGVERIEVYFSSPIAISGHQFFIAVDQLSDGVLLISDSEIKSATCTDGTEEFRYQCIKTSDNRWWTGKYAYGISAIMNYDGAAPLLTDMTSEGGLEDIPSINESMAWADIDDDGYPDLLTSGRLYRNLGNRKFRDITLEMGLAGLPRANLFLDINTDGRIDILFLGSTDSTTSSSVLFVATESGSFRRKLLELPGLEDPTSFSLADFDSDGYIDLFLGQGRDSTGTPLRNVLLLNDRKEAFIDRTSLLYPAAYQLRASQGSQWTDVNGDGFPDLFVVNQGEDACEMWRNNGDGTFSMVYGPAGTAPAQIRSVGALGGHWRDYNKDGAPDLLLSQHSRLATVGNQPRQSGVVLEVEDALSFGLSPVSLDSMSIPYGELRGGGTWGDVDNDGELDILLASGSGCRFADLYVRNEHGKYEARTAQYGLLHVPTGPGAMWIDIDNDGLLDLATFLHHRLHLYRNTSPRENNYASIDVSTAGGIGTKVELYASGQRYAEEVTSGHGLLLQDPLRLHIGLGSVAVIDSMIVRWPDGQIEVVRDVAVNATTKIRRSTTEPNTQPLSSGIADIRVFPNPFSNRVEIIYRLAERQRVVVEIFSQDGRPVAKLHDDVQDAGVQSIAWTAIGDDGGRLPQGEYLYRITGGSNVMTGILMLVR